MALNSRERHAGEAGGEPPALTLARRLHNLQHTRDDALGAKLFGDPAWDILLDLFVSHHDRTRLSVSAVCIGVNGCAATVLRYLAILQHEGLVARIRDESDGRRSYVELTPDGCAKLEALLARYAMK